MDASVLVRIPLAGLTQSQLFYNFSIDLEDTLLQLAILSSPELYKRTGHHVRDQRCREGGSKRVTVTRHALSRPQPRLMASVVAILDLKGKPLIQRSYRDDVAPSNLERFLPLVLELEEDGNQVTPCFSSQGINFMHIRHNNVYRT